MGILMWCKSASGAIVGTDPMCIHGLLYVISDATRLILDVAALKEAVLVILQEDVNAAAVARMVDMSLEEVADLLGGASSCGAGTGDSGLLAKQVAQTLLELEAALMTSSGKHAAKQSRSSENQMDGQAVEEMLEGLQHHASR